jgi:hypothetical protein
MLPPQLLDWSVWTNLDRHRSVELILLKGHLLLEVVLAEVLLRRTSLSESQINRLSFYAKSQTLVETDERLFHVMDHVGQLNRLRNKLAHEPFPQELQMALVAWSERVIAAYAIQKYQKYTHRTKITQAVGALARKIYEHALNGDHALFQGYANG